jgi:hypothetical protein
MNYFEEQAYMKGVLACKMGQDLHQNPFTQEPFMSIWEDGYDDCLATGTMKRNLLSGGQIFVEHGTSRCCDPSTEAYWSM